MAWLSARPRGRWATARGRWFHTVLTAGLLVAGFSAWALALIQPWAGHTGYYGQEAVSVLDAGRVRSMAAELDRLATSDEHAPPKTPKRNPFALPAAAAATAPAPAPRATAGADTGSAPRAIAAPVLAPAPAVSSGISAKAVLDAARALRLDVTLIAPSGERWAVINGQNYREGDAVAGFQVTEIQEGKVRLQQAGMTCLLRMD
jgi:hypothetical protein